MALSIVLSMPLIVSLYMALISPKCHHAFDMHQIIWNTRHECLGHNARYAMHHPYDIPVLCASLITIYITYVLIDAALDLS
jgi:hypothetical protein